MKFIHQEYESAFPFGGRIPQKRPTTPIFCRPGGPGSKHNDADSIYRPKKNEDQYYIEYNKDINTPLDLTWMLSYQIFWDNDPSYKALGIKVDDNVLQLLNEELQLNLVYRCHLNGPLNGHIEFEHEAYHNCDEQEKHFMNLMLLDRRDGKLNKLL